MESEYVGCNLNITCTSWKKVKDQMKCPVWKPTETSTTIAAIGTLNASGYDDVYEMFLSKFILGSYLEPMSSKSDNMTNLPVHVW